MKWNPANVGASRSWSRLSCLKWAIQPKLAQLPSDGEDEALLRFRVPDHFQPYSMFLCLLG